MSVIYDLVKNVVIYLILITVVMNLMGNSSYKKYIGMFTGMILIIIVASPILNIFQLNDDLDYYLDIHQFSIDTKELNTELSVASEEQKSIVMKEYEDTLKQQVNKLLSNMELSLVEFDAAIVDDQGNDNYGTIEQITIVATKGTSTESVVTDKIEKVTIDKITIEDTDQSEQKPENNQKGEDSVLASLVKKEVAGLYELEQNQIIVEIQEN